MPADNTPPIRKCLAAEAKGVATDPINLAIAREVLRRVRERELPIAAKNAGTEKRPEQRRVLPNIQTQSNPLRVIWHNSIEMEPAH